MPRLSTNSALWLTRALWLVTYAVVPAAIKSASDGRASAAESVSVWSWLIVAFVAFVALVVCGPTGLTLLRMLVPSAVPVAVLALVFGAESSYSVLALAASVLVTLMAFMAETGEAMVQTTAYGDEKRLPLRVPAAMQIPIAISWTLWLAVALTGVLLLAAQKLASGIVVVLLAFVLAWLLYRRLHPFSCRWLVSVPAGVVVHDPVVLGETLMVMRANVQQAHLALADTQAADLTGPAGGHAVEVTVHEMTQVTFPATRKNPKGSAIHAQSFLIAPSRPGRALQTLADRKVRVS